ncbi:MAG: hypothetical protein J5I90_22005 [Caldilineales bacterium]|nr:hypothetical protein [Caldilineales bacterium]
MKTQRFTFRLEPVDNKNLTLLANHFHRGHSDTIRWLIYTSAARLGVKDQHSEEPQSMQIED